MITTQLLPAAGLLPFVFTRSCEVKEVGESCRYVWLAVWISGIRYPEAFFFSSLYYPPSSEKLKEGEKFWKNHTAPPNLQEEGGRQHRQREVWVSVSSFFLLRSTNLKWIAPLTSLPNNSLMDSQCGVRLVLLRTTWPNGNFEWRTQNNERQSSVLNDIRH